MIKTAHIVARDLPDAWFQCVDACLEHGRQWTVEQGSYEGQKRWELDFVTVHITHPGTRPLAPEMPPHLSHIPPPTTEEYIEEYLPYLMTADLKINEQYTYGSRLVGPSWRSKLREEFTPGEPDTGQVLVQGQMTTVINRFKRNHGTNQCSMSIAQPSDISLPDPPCLREIDCRIFAPDGLHDGEEPALHFYIYFRSWDLWNGFPSNLGGIRLMQEYMAGEIGVEPGEMICMSKGLHIYDHAWDIAKLRVQ